MAREMTAEVRDEMIRMRNRHQGCRKAQLAAILRMTAEMRVRGGLTMVAEVTSAATARYLRREIAALWKVPVTATVLGRDRFEIRVTQGAGGLAQATGLLDGRGREAMGLPVSVVGGTLTEIAAAWRGAFIAAGTLTAPGRNAAMTIHCPSPETAHALVSCARRLGVLAAVRETRDGEQVLIRDADSIVAMMMRMGLIDAIAEWERRGVRQRNDNFTNANARRTAEASVENCAKVEWALDLLGGVAPENLAETGKLRLAHRDASLEELGRYASPPLTKDAVAGRLRRLLALADKHAAAGAVPQRTLEPAMAGTRV
jgi:DNA-binding protein WhiA